MKSLILATALALTALPMAAAAHDSTAAVQAGSLQITGAFTRATLPRAPVGGGYLTLTNQGAEADRLIGVTAPVGTEVQIHEMTMADGVMTMRHLPDGLEIPAGQTVALEPGGYHLMIVGLSDPLVEGGHLDMVLTFEKAGDVTVPFDIMAINAKAAGAAADHTGHGG